MSYLRQMGRNMGKMVGALLLLALVAGCSATYRNHGYLPPKEDVDLIEVGKDTRETVSASIGKPGTSGLLAGSGYYYVRSRFKYYLYNAPQEIDREVLAITFTENGVVENIERFGLEDGRIVVLERRVTDSNIKGVGFLRQLFGSIGRIDVAEQIRGN
ncbi:Beta-barrel assembly machine subunit BamE [Aliiroseovarius sediminilitoris]|uniref:Beta-barrel assembly machine subunit BamE n=1 Tax=Aliiroseovarius sediminilitoris TaxID=1173584 RepID=A0A1I0Q4E5_9RHOB|nr:outer membrane protein assembly factor BamE [Aliiroseovarius sediminilitoris]SEW21770.1 Beta-barrel assembly machine subunit BamE [Aliiroseovarius sediminilitoris]